MRLSQTYIYFHLVSLLGAFTHSQLICIVCILNFTLPNNLSERRVEGEGGGGREGGGERERERERCIIYFYVLYRWLISVES